MRRFWPLVLGVVLGAFAAGCGKEEKVTMPDNVPPQPTTGPVSGASSAPASTSTGTPVK